MAEPYMRPYTDRYAQLALGMADRLRKKTDRFSLAKRLWELADYLERQGKHDQHLIQLGVNWIKAL